MKTILLIHPGPFGYHTPTYYYCLLLRNKYKITYLGIDENRENKNIDGIRYIHLAGGQNSIAKRISYFKAIYKEMKDSRYDFVLVNYFIFCSIVRLFTRNNVVVEIRTSFIFNNFIKRFSYNMFLHFEVKLFKNITTISAGLSNYLCLPKRTFIIPLGAPSFPFIKKDFGFFKILYVGTFNGRNVTNTIYAFAKFIRDFKGVVMAKYTIIGFGSTAEIQQIYSTIKEVEMDNYISYEGIVRYPELIEYFRENNVGMSYIPIKKRYKYQPPLKTFEYLLSGMAVLATKTDENDKIINDSNGVIVGDSIEDIYNGLKNIFINRFSYSSEDIQKVSQKYSWENIVKNNLVPYIESFSPMQIK